MPIIGSAIKKLRQDKKRLSQNLLVKKAVKEAVKVYKKTPNIGLLSKLDSLLSRGVKKNIYHANKAARLKSRLSKMLVKKVTKTEASGPANKAKKTAKSVPKKSVRKNS